MTANSFAFSASWIYVMPAYYGDSVAVSLPSGAIAPNNVNYASGGKFNTAVNAIYGTRDRLSPSDIQEYDISTVPITRQFDSPYHGDYSVFGPVWFSPDGSRIYTGCAMQWQIYTAPIRTAPQTSTVRFPARQPF